MSWNIWRCLNQRTKQKQRRIFKFFLASVYSRLTHSYTCLDFLRFLQRWLACPICNDLLGFIFASARSDWFINSSLPLLLVNTIFGSSDDRSCQREMGSVRCLRAFTLLRHLISNRSSMDLDKTRTKVDVPSTLRVSSRVPLARVLFTISPKWRACSQAILKSVLRSHEDRSHWCVVSRQIIPNKGGLSSLFTLLWWRNITWDGLCDICDNDGRPPCCVLGDPGAVSRAGRKGMAKVFKHRRKSPWVPTLTGPFPNGQANAGSWLGTKNALYYCAQSTNS